MKREYILEIMDRKTKQVVQTETRKSEKAFQRLWENAIKNVNPLQYKITEKTKFD